MYKNIPKLPESSSFLWQTLKEFPRHPFCLELYPETNLNEEMKRFGLVLEVGILPMKSFCEIRVSFVLSLPCGDPMEVHWIGSSFKTVDWAQVEWDCLYPLIVLMYEEALEEGIQETREMIGELQLLLEE